MTLKIAQLREKRAELHKEANNLLDQNGDVWSSELQAKFDGLVKEASICEDLIDNQMKVIDDSIAEDFRDVEQFRRSHAPVSAEHRAVDLYMRKMARELTNEEALLIRNTMSTTTGSEGGYTVPALIASEFVDTLKDYQGMRRESSQITTTGGNDMSFPTTDGTAEVGEWVAQNASAAAADIVFGTRAVNTFKAGSKIIAVPIELLQDSAIDIQALVFKRAAQRIGRISNQGYTTGTGSAQPNGVVTAATVGKTGTTGQTLTVIYDDLVDVVDAIDFAYLTSSTKLCWMFNQTTRKVVRKIKDTGGRPIWSPSYDAGIAGGTPDQLLGYDVCINNDLASPAANAKSIAFGDFSKYLIRDALDVSVFRFDDSAYLSKGQIGFLAWARTGGNLLDLAAVRLYQHSAT